MSRCPYSRRRLREAPEEVNELVTREIERRIADGQISRAQCMDTHWDWLKRAVLDAAAEAAPARSGRRPMKPGFDVATLLLRERRKKLLPELKEAEAAGRAAEAATLRSTYRKLTKDIKKSSRRAKAAEWKQRNETLRECARDPSRAKQFWNVVFQKTAKDVHRAIELWVNEQKSETTSDPVAVATTFRDNYERIGADTPPRGNTFCESARRRQDERVYA